MQRLGALLMMLAACDGPSPEETGAGSPRTTTAAADAASSAAQPKTSVPHPLGDAAEWAACDRSRAEVRNSPAAPGNPKFEQDRIAMVGRVRGATALWKREPQPDAPEAAAKLESAGRALRAVRDAIHRHRKSPEKLRAMFLREGYFYVRGVDTAVAAVQQLGLTQLFDAPVLHLVRDGVAHELRRHKKQYTHVGGERDGEPAELLFADRVGTELTALHDNPAAVDFSAAMEEHGFGRLKVDHLTEHHLVGSVRYGGATGQWVPALFDVRGASAKLTCHAVPTADADQVAVAYSAAQRIRDVQAKVRDAALAQVRERLPFDAPRGAGDPTDKYPLRARWKDAYAKSRRSFRFSGRRYDVYDDRGRPRPPQVCIDFVYDTWERASGTWYRPMAEEGGKLQPSPERLLGKLNMDDLELENRRRVARFLDFAEAHPETFDVWIAPKEDRVVFEKHDAFFAALAKHVEQFRRGDMLVVRRPKLGKLALHHTMIIIEIDPITGIPARLAGNASRPRIQTFEGVMQTSPRRYLQWRIRPRETWLDAAVLATTGN